MRLTPLILMLSVAVLVGSATGCGQPPAQDPNDIVLYLANAQVRGKVRRLWPAAQEYATKVLKANVAYNQSLGCLPQMEEVEQLWTRDAAEWRDADTVHAQITALKAALTPAAVAERQRLRQALVAAIHDVPADIQSKLSNDQPLTTFFDKEFAALGGMPEELVVREATLTDLARQRLALYELLLDGDTKFIAAESGLAVTEAARQSELLALYAALEEAANGAHLAALTKAEKRVALADARLEQFRQEKATLKAELRQRAQTPADVQRLRAIEDQIDYEMAVRAFNERRLRDLQKTAEARKLLPENP